MLPSFRDKRVLNLAQEIDKNPDYRIPELLLKVEGNLSLKERKKNMSDNIRFLKYRYTSVRFIWEQTKLRNSKRFMDIRIITFNCFCFGTRFDKVQKCLENNIKAG